MPKQFVFGVDAGGSKTKVLLGELVDGGLRPIGQAVGGAGNPRSVGFDAALGTIRDTVYRAYASAGIEPTIADFACFSVAGAGRFDERQRILEWCKRTSLVTEAVVVGDAECLLAAARTSSQLNRQQDTKVAFEIDPCGVALIAGTGSIVWGRNKFGATSRAGGCGFLFDDEGSGYWLAVQALRHICMATDARRVRTSLVEAVLQHLQLSNPQELIGWCFEAANPRTQIASLAPVVFQEYTRDEVAREIVHAGARALAGLVIAVARELSFSSRGFTLACAGSVFLQQPLYRRLLETELERQHAIPCEVCLIEDPAVGALQIAWSRLAFQ